MVADRDILAAVCGLSLIVTASIVNAAVDVSGSASCVHPESVTAALEEVLREHSASHEVDLLVTVTEKTSGESTIVMLRALTGDGDKVLDREFELSSADCASSTELLRTVTRRFVQALPLERWTLEPPSKKEPPQVVAPAVPPPSPIEKEDPLLLTVAVRAAADLQIAPVGGSFEGGVVGDVGKGSHALSLDIGVRGSIPQSLGQGTYHTLLLLGGVGWRFMIDEWMGRVLARAGTVRVAGTGFATDDAEWLPWVELGVGFGRRLGPVVLMVGAAVSPHRHSAVTADGSLKQEMSNVRIGVTLEIPLIETDF